MPAIAALGMQAAGNLVNEGMGIAFQGIKNKQEAKQYRNLQNISLEGEATRLQRTKAAELQMWKDTSYPAQMEMMKKAGLNPALMYGMGGGGGTTTGSGAAPTSGGGSGTANASRGAEGMGLMMGQMGLLKAQEENINADTAKKKIEAAKLAGVDTDLGKTQIESLRQGITNAQTINAINTWEEKIKKIDYNVANQTESDRMSNIRSVAEAAASTAEAIERDNQIAEETKGSKIQQIKAEAVGAVLKNALTEAQTANTQQATEQSKAQIMKWGMEILQGWQTLSQNDKRIRLEGIGKKMEVERGYDWRNVRYHYSEKELVELIDKIVGGK